MKTPDDNASTDERDLRAHYDFDYARAKPNRFAEELSGEAMMIVLEPEIAAAFPSSEAVNAASRLVMRLSEIPTTPPRRQQKKKAAGA